MTIHVKVSAVWRFQDSIELDAASTNVLQGVYFASLSGEQDNIPFQRAYIQKELKKISRAFEDKVHGERILLAAQWLFDSYSTDNEMLSFVQAMICIEILLGDKLVSDRAGVGELLRNRCAYLIGKNADQRAEIMEQFQRIYDVRSAIVHRGKSRISSKERGLFSILRWYCRRVIQEELSLLQKSS